MTRFTSLFTMIIFLAAVCGTARAQNGTTFTYQGELKENGGLANGSFNMDFALWDAMDGGNQIGSTVPKPNVQVVDGKFTVELDFGAAPYATDSSLWLEIAVAGTPLSPRQRLTPAPYSLATRGIHVAESGDVGIGTDMPEAPLHVSGDIRGEKGVAMGNDAYFGLGQGPYPTFERIHDFSHRITDFTSTNVYTPILSVMTLDPNHDMDVVEIFANSFEASTAATCDRDFTFVNGLFGASFHQGSGTMGASYGAFLKSAVAGTGDIANNFGVVASAGSASLGSILENRGIHIHTGHWGVGGDIQTNYGLYVQSPDHVQPISANYGIYLSDQNVAQVTNYSIYSAGGDVYFDGDLDVTGTLSKGGGSFKIDHPLDPENKFLYHSFVESPDMMNIYNGNAILDKSGRAIIRLPEWFDALNRDFRYQLTCIGGFAPVYVETKIENNQFAIAGGKEGMEISWQVTGVRQDAWAEANRIPVEEGKVGHEVGHYLHPEVYGLDREMSIHAAREALQSETQSKSESDSGKQITHPIFPNNKTRQRSK